MSDQMKTAFAPEQIRKQAQANLGLLLLAVVAYLKERGLPVREYCSYVGRRITPLWRDVTTATDLAKWAALNVVSAGGNLRSLSGDESRAEALTTGWPSEKALSLFGITQEDADPIWDTMQTIADSIGFTYEWHRQGDEFAMTFSRTSKEQQR